MGYNNIRIKEGDQEKAAFTTPLGQYVLRSHSGRERQMLLVCVCLTGFSHEIS